MLTFLHFIELITSVINMKVKSRTDLARFLPRIEAILSQRNLGKLVKKVEQIMKSYIV